MWLDGTKVSEYAYTTNGSRSTKWTSAGTATSSYDDQDRLTQTVFGSTTTTYAYLDSGELSSKTEGTSTTLYKWDGRGNLLRVDLPDGKVVEYVVDPLGRRVGKKVKPSGGSLALTKRWIYDGQLRIVAEIDATGTTYFVYGLRPNVPEYAVRGGTTYRIVTDHLGSVRLVVNASTGGAVQRMDYDEFGIVTKDEKATGWAELPFGYAGGVYDRDTGLVRFGAREYDALTGSWISKDPIGFAGGDTNLYGYVGNDPVNRVDPTGLKVIVEGDFDFQARFWLNAASDPMTQRNLEAMERSSTNWHIRRAKRKGGNVSYCPDESGIPGVGAIFWDPNSTLYFDGGGFGTPGLMLFHETSHAALHEAGHPFPNEEAFIVSGEQAWVDRANDAYGWLGFHFAARSSYGGGTPVTTNSPWSFDF